MKWKGFFLYHAYDHVCADKRKEKYYLHIKNWGDGQVKLNLSFKNYLMKWFSSAIGLLFPGYNTSLVHVFVPKSRGGHGLDF